MMLPEVEACLAFGAPGWGALGERLRAMDEIGEAALEGVELALLHGLLEEASP